MKITDLEVILLRCPVPDPQPRPTASFVFDGSIYVRVHTDEGISGIGEPSPYGGPLGQVKRLLETEIKQRLVGRSPFDVEMLTTQREFPGPSGYGNVPYNCAIAGIGHALWDIVGKALDMPVCTLLNKTGDCRDSVPAYASGGMSLEAEDPHVVVDEALLCKQQGYRAWKMRPCTPGESSHMSRQGRPPAIDVGRMLGAARKVRDAVGPEMDLLIDLGCRCGDIEEAVEICGALGQLGFYLVEEPLVRVPEDYAALAERIDAPVSGGECLVTCRQLRSWIDRGAYQIIQPDGNLAGITEVLRAAAVAQTRGVPCVLHNWANAVSIAANVHLAAAIPNCPMVEFAVPYNPLRTELVHEPIVPTDGVFHVPERPGLGVELDEQAVRKYRFDG